MTSWEAINNYFNNFSDLSVKTKVEKSEQKKVNDTRYAVSESVKNIDIYTKKVNGADSKKSMNNHSFGDIFKKENIDHIKEHIVENKRFAEKYIDNPAAALKDENVKVKINAKEAAEIEKQLKDENSLTLFAELTRNSELTGKDILECLKRFNKLTKSQKKRLFFASMSADEVANMSPEQVARRMARTMRKLARLRKSMSAEDRAFIAEMMSKSPKECEDHIDKVLENRKTYKDKDVKNMAENMEEMSDEEKIKYTENISALGEIKDENDNPKYSGDVNVKVAKDMVDEPRAEDAILSTAKREDMDGKHLSGISSNLVLNPDMIPSYAMLLDAKDSKGADKFGKGALLSQTNYMVDKSIDEIEKYTGKVLDYAQYDAISGDEATSLAEDVMTNPSSEAAIDEMVESKVSASESSSVSDSTGSEGVFGATSSVSFSFESPEKISAALKSDLAKNSEEVMDKETYYKKLADDFRAQYGKAADTMIQLCIEKPEVVKALFTNPNITFATGMAFIKKYGTNVELIAEIAKNPRNIDKLKLASASITTPQLVELAKLSEKRGVDFVVEMIQKYNPTKAITLCSAPDSEKIKTQMKKGNNALETQEYLNYHFQREFIA